MFGNAGGIDPSLARNFTYAPGHAQAQSNMNLAAGIGGMGGRGGLVAAGLPTSASQQQTLQNLGVGFQPQQQLPYGGLANRYGVMGNGVPNQAAMAAARVAGTNMGLRPAGMDRNAPLTMQALQTPVAPGGGLGLQWQAGAGAPQGGALGLPLQSRNLQLNAQLNLQGGVQQQTMHRIPGLAGFTAAHGAGAPPQNDLLSMMGKQQGLQVGAAAGAPRAFNQLGALNTFGAGAQPGAAHQAGLTSMLHAAQAGQGTQVQEADTPAFDVNDFPTLNGAAPRRGAEAAGPGPAGADTYRSQALGSRAVLPAGPTQEFSLHNPEEFPALQTAHPAVANQSADDRLFGAGPLGAPPGAKSGEGVAGKGPAGPIPDRFGLLGLLNVIRMTDQDLTMLALGTDLTSLGLNLNSPDSLYKTFMSPLADNPIKAEPEFRVPACYKQTPLRLQPGFLSKFKEETLFYIFYSMAHDEAQMIAADELFTRGWWWHKKFRCWFIHAPNTAVQKAPTGRSEKGTYLFFDASNWDVIQKADIEISYEDIEVFPRLNRAKPAAGRH